MRLRRLINHISDQNWTAVVFDFVIVVVGVGVALAGQQWMADRQQRTDMARAEEALQGDLIANYYFAKERVALAQCRKDAYQALGDQLLEPGGPWTGMPRPQSENYIDYALPVVLRSPSRYWGSSTWDAELARGTFAQMDDTRRALLTSFFQQADRAEAIQEEVHTLQSRLKLLAVDTELTREARLGYYDLLAELDERSAYLEFISAQNIDLIENIGVDLPEEEAATIQASLADLNAQARAVYGECHKPMSFDILGSVAAEGEEP